jgi:hypothetical protein
MGGGDFADRKGFWEKSDYYPQAGGVFHSFARLIHSLG